MTTITQASNSERLLGEGHHRASDLPRPKFAVTILVHKNIIRRVKGTTSSHKTDGHQETVMGNSSRPFTTHTRIAGLSTFERSQLYFRAATPAARQSDDTPYPQGVLADFDFETLRALVSAVQSQQRTIEPNPGPKHASPTQQHAPKTKHADVPYPTVAMVTDLRKLFPSTVQYPPLAVACLGMYMARSEPGWVYPPETSRAGEFERLHHLMELQLRASGPSALQLAEQLFPPAPVAGVEGSDGASSSTDPWEWDGDQPVVPDASSESSTAPPLPPRPNSSDTPPPLPPRPNSSDTPPPLPPRPSKTAATPAPTKPVVPISGEKFNDSTYGLTGELTLTREDAVDKRTDDHRHLSLRNCTLDGRPVTYSKYTVTQDKYGWDVAALFFAAFQLASELVTMYCYGAPCAWFVLAFLIPLTVLCLCRGIKREKRVLLVGDTMLTVLDLMPGVTESVGKSTIYRGVSAANVDQIALAQVVNDTWEFHVLALENNFQGDRQGLFNTLSGRA